MSKFSELRDLQCQLISQLKGREYKDLLSMPSSNDYQLDDKFKNFSLVRIMANNGDGGIKWVS